MGRTYVVAIMGAMGTGKTSLAEFMMEELNGQSSKNETHMLRLAFADALKRDVANAYKFPLEDCYTQEGKNSLIPLHETDLALPDGKKPGDTATVRELLQFYGQHKRKDYDLYWCIQWLDEFNRATRGLEGDCIVFVDDVRFGAELRFLKDVFHKCFAIFMHRYPGYQIKSASNHVSETELQAFRQDNTLIDLHLHPDLGENVLKNMAKQFVHSGLFLPVMP